MKLLVPSKGPLCKILEREENATQIKGPYRKKFSMGRKRRFLANKNKGGKERCSGRE